MSSDTTKNPAIPRQRRLRLAARAVLGVGVIGGAAISACSAWDAGQPESKAPVYGSVTQAITPSPGAKDFITFESGPVRPLAKSPNGTKLFVTNTPDNHLEIYNIDGGGNLTAAGSVRVGLEPVAVAARNDSEVWVVNHLSDSVSIVDVAANPPRVKKTLLVGDEPRDIVFSANGRAFITAAHRGQNRSLVAANKFTTGTNAPQLTTASVPRADVWVFDPAALGTTLGGDPIKVVELFGDTARALALSPNGATVYAAVFNSGNQTTVITEGAVCEGSEPCVVNGVQYPGGDWGPSTNHAGLRAPHVGLMAKYDNATGTWKDLVGRNWNNAVRLNVPDKDVFAIDQVSLAETANFVHVGTTLFNMATNPVSGKVYVSNTDSQNHNRFEGPGTFVPGQTVQGNLARSRITVLNGATVTPIHLNKHINYAVRPAPAGTKEASLATPLGMAVSSNGSTLYVAAFGSSKVGVYSTAALEANTFDPVSSANNDHIAVTGGGPAGIVLNEAANRAYVLTRFDNGISVLDTAVGEQTAHLKMHNPEPQHVVQGRPFHYDAFNTSSNGEASCASCHIFADKDELSWDLGNPDDDVKTTQYPIHLEEVIGLIGLEPELSAIMPAHLNGTGNLEDLHSMKGPMATQTFRGMQNHGAMHWRGDRSKGFFGNDTRNEPPFDSRLSFKNFIVAFAGLVGRSGITDLADTEMDQFADFALELFMPPNPIRNLDQTLTAAQTRGLEFFMGCDGVDSFLYLPVSCGAPGSRPSGSGHFSDGSYLFGLGERCEGCHTLDPAKGFFGTNGEMSFELLQQIVKVPQLRNMYTKVGMFGFPAVATENAFENEHQGDQIRSFGFMSNGQMDILLRFFNGKVFNKRGPFGAVGFSASDPQAQRRDVVDFVMAFPSDLAPVVGQQITLTSTNAAVANPRIDLLKARANTNFTSKLLGTGIKECELVASGVQGGVMKSWLWRPDTSNFESDDGTTVTDATLRGYAATAGQELTFTCVPPGSGVRVALDRDRDTFANRLDLCPADSGCGYTPAVCTGGMLDCDQAPQPTCTQYTSTVSSHYNAGRATRTWRLLYYDYYAKGSGNYLGTNGSATKTLKTTDGGTNYYEGTCPAWVPCEKNGNTDLNNCGACGNVCNFAHAGDSCNSGVCQMGACETGYTDCDGSDLTGCEANLQNSVDNCGTCGTTCDAPHAADSCSSGSCVMGACDTGWQNCNGQAVDGCEIDTQNDRDHCGNCTTVCDYANAGSDCVSGACQMGECEDGFADCNSTASDGCEVNLATNANNCGACNNVCSFANATAVCSASTCQLGACNSGWSNCDGNAANGCETSGTSCGGVAFTYTPSNFNPTDPNLAPTVTNSLTTLNCGTSTFNSSTLTFTNWCGQPTPSPVVKTQTNGPDVVILPTRSLTIASGNTLQITGNRPVILAVYGDATINGTVDASASGLTAGAGGNLLCTGGVGGDGVGNTGSDDGGGGAGGGAFGSAGANGAVAQGAAGIGGAVIGNASLVPLRGGCNGGLGGRGQTSSLGREGGGGGGAIQISASANTVVNGTVAAAGGGGRRGTNEEDGGGGGGSGGGVLLEGYYMTVASTAWLTANGGGGASGAHEDQANAVNGADGGKTTTARASGGVCPLDGGRGGDGAAAAGGATNGQNGNTNDDGAGAGGGGVGRIRVNGYGSCSLAGNQSPVAVPGSCCAGSCGGSPPDSGCTAQSYNGKSYWFCSTARTWTEARNNCMAVGHTLVTIESSGENAFVDTNLGSGVGWIGFTDLEQYVTEGTFSWQSGRAIPYTAWNSGEPNNWNGIEDCTEQYNGGNWNDADCAATKPYVCEDAQVTNQTQVNENGTANLTCSSGTIKGWTAMYGDLGGTCPVSCMSCTLNSASCSILFNNANCGDCNVGTMKPGYLKLSCQ